MDPVRAAVGDVVELDTQDRPQHRPNGTAVRNDEDTMVSMSLDDRREPSSGSTLELRLALASVGCIVVRARQPGLPGRRLRLDDLVNAPALPAAQGALAEIRVSRQRNRTAIEENPGGLERALEIAAVSNIDSVLRKTLGQRPGLSPASVVEGRVLVPLNASVTIPIGFAVADKIENRHQSRRANGQCTVL